MEFRRLSFGTGGLSTRLVSLMAARNFLSFIAFAGWPSVFRGIAPVGIKTVAKLKSTLADASDISRLATEMAVLHFDGIKRLTEEIEDLTAKIQKHCRESETAKRLRAMPGIGPD